MIEKETTVKYLLLHILPVAISGFVAIFCFWLGVFREKHKEKKKQLSAAIKHKENIVLSLWEVSLYADQNKDAISKFKIESKMDQLNVHKYFLIPFNIDFYNIAKNSILFDFDYELKSDLLLLKVIAEDANKLISLHNDILSSMDVKTTYLVFMKHIEEQITKACNNISEIYGRLVKNEDLCVLFLKHFEKLEEMRNMINKKEKIQTLESFEPKFKPGEASESHLD
ncbi:MAG: hypothetical protein HS127_20235 [Planctomycetia bacterium]|uniref:hypothetical protein n=1 Tax=Candidatus Kuenenia sp. TaxID=2499824 RepID=UPI001D32E7BC|nr:hypothetical protein [Planctomycetia bacterium]